MDTYFNFLDVNKNIDDLEPMKERFMWKVCDPKDIYSEYKRGDGLLKSMKDVLSDDDILGGCVNSLYAYISVPLKWDELNN